MANAVLKRMEDTVLPSAPSGEFQGARHLFSVRAYYEDTDLSGIVYHANYLRWFERARSDMLRLLGVDQRAASEAGEGHYAVADIAIRYLAPARLDDVVTVATDVLELGAASVRLRQVAFRFDKPQTVILAEATIRVGFIGANNRPRRQPAGWRAAFQPFLTAKDAA